MLRVGAWETRKEGYTRLAHPLCLGPITWGLNPHPFSHPSLMVIPVVAGGGGTWYGCEETSETEKALSPLVPWHLSHFSLSRMQVCYAHIEK